MAFRMTAPLSQSGLPILRTKRVILREWRDSDLTPFAAMNADQAVMEHFPAPLRALESDALVERIRAHFAKHHFGLWAIEIPNVTPFAGFCGLAVPQFEAKFTPCVEIGWRLASEYWGRGYATEAARAVLAYAFDTVGLDEVVSFTAAQNARSINVMSKIGMQRNTEDDFNHPLLPKDHRISKHVLYRISRNAHRSTHHIGR